MIKYISILFLSLLSSGIFAQDPYNNLNGHNSPLRITGYKINTIINDPTLAGANSNSIVTASAIKSYVDAHAGSGTGGAVSSVNGQTGAVVIIIPDISGKQDTSFRDTLLLDYGLIAIGNQLFLQKNTPYNINTQSAASYTLDSSDIGKVLTFNNSSATTLTIPAGLRVGFNCTVIQTGSGQVTFSGGSVTIHQSNSYTKTLKQFSVVRLNCYATNTFVLDGEMQ